MTSYPIINTGTGRNTITLLISENAWANGDLISDASGDAMFLVFVNGVQQGGTFTAWAPHATSGEQTFNFSGNFTQTATVQVKFVNDAWGGTAVTDRNLYVDKVSYDTSNQNESAPLFSNGSVGFPIASTENPVNNGSGPDTVSLQISENAWANHDKISDGNGDAQFTVTINGAKQGGTFTATAAHGSGDQTFNFSGTFGTAPTVQATFVNDAYGGTPSTDRNLFVDSVSYDGVNQNDAAALYSNSTATFQLQGGTLPTVLSLATSPGSGDLAVGKVVQISLNVSKTVKVTGTPTLSLNDGGTATYVSGSGSNTLVFSYTVQAGQNTPDLAVTSVNLNGGTIVDGAGNAANLASAVTNPAGILQIDTTTPIVTAVTESPSTGSVVTGQTVTLALDMSEAVTVSGVPTLGLNDGGTATYAAGSGSSVLTFSYTVLAGQTTPDLAVTSVNMNGGAITDGAGNAANLTGAATNPAGVVQVNGTTVPAFYVSPNGNDSWSGDLASPNSTGTDGPFKTLARAKQAMEQSSTIKTTNVEAGTYSIASQPLTFNSQDSGETWVRYQSDTATIDGGGTGYVDGTVNNLTIKGLTFQNLGVGPRGGGVFLSGSGETIRWNTFLNSKDSAISGAGLTNSLIDSNTVNGQSPGNFNGTANAYAAMDFWDGSSGNTISHNLIENAQGGGIMFAAGSSDSPNNNNIVDSNLLKNVDSSVFDFGAIYMYDRTHSATGNKITNNVVDGNGNGSNADQTKGIYLDDMSNVQVTGNVLYGNAGQYGIQFHGGDHNTVQKNIFDLSPGETLGLYQDDPSWGEFGMTANDFQSNIVYYESTSPNPQWRWIQSGSSMSHPTDTTNLYYSATGTPISNSGQIVDSNPYYANPQFQNASTGNFSMSSTSPTYTDIGWNTLPTNQGPLPYQP